MNISEYILEKENNTTKEDNERIKKIMRKNADRKKKLLKNKKKEDNEKKCRELREILIAFDIMQKFDIKHENIEESIEYFLKHKEQYLCLI
tara:strand:- start:115 stop:387 length:273 start_codon:yes stop_codon:yes gene_type:complete